jgi:hypothetical protein
MAGSKNKVVFPSEIVMAVIPSHLNFICANDEIENVRSIKERKDFIA